MEGGSKLNNLIITVKNSWAKWSIVESFVRVISNALQKSIGDLLQSAGAVFYGTAAMGLVQMVLGFALAKTTKQKIIVSRQEIVGSVAFGAMATACIALSFLALRDGLLSLHIFITTLGIVPGAIIDRAVFGHKLGKLQITGIALGVLAGYVALECPSLSEIKELPLWMLFSFLAMMGMTINQAITQKIKDINPLVKNFWGGMVIFLLAAIIAVAIGASNPITTYPVKIAEIAMLIGVLSVLLWTVNLYAYRGGAFIAIKKLVVFGGAIILGAIWGAVFFDETLSLFHLLGFILYCLAFILLDRDTFNFFRDILSRMWSGGIFGK